MPELLGLGALQSGLNFLGAGINYGINKNLMGYQYDLNEKAAKNADKRQRALYNDFMSPSARIRMLKEAGLSPSLYADGAGAGSMGMTQGAQGTGAGSAVGTMFENANMAEIMKKQSEARLNNAEADKLEGKNAEGEAYHAKLWADAGYTKVSAQLKQEQITQQQWQNYITSETANININTAYSLAEEAANNAIKSTFEILIAQAEAHVAEATIETQIEQAEANIKYTEAQTLLAKSGIKLNEANAQKAIAEINKWREELQIEWKGLYNEIYKANTERMKWRTMDESMLRQMHRLEERLSFDKDLRERKFLWTIVHDTYNAAISTGNMYMKTP